MASATSICSNALLMLGADPINDLVAEEGDRAILALNLWPTSRDAIIRAHMWDCCIKRLTLAPLVAAPEYGWAFQYQLPGDCVRLIGIGPVDGYAVNHKVEGRTILANYNPLFVRYLFKNEDVETWDAGMVSYAEAYMAARMAWPITKDRGVASDMNALAASLLRQARGADAQQGVPDAILSSPLLEVRGYGSRGY